MKYTLKQQVKIKTGQYKDWTGTVEAAYDWDNNDPIYYVRLFANSNKPIAYNESDLTTLDDRD